MAGTERSALPGSVGKGACCEGFPDCNARALNRLGYSKNFDAEFPATRLGTYPIVKWQAKPVIERFSETDYLTADH